MTNNNISRIPSDSNRQAPPYACAGGTQPECCPNQESPSDTSYICYQEGTCPNPICCPPPFVACTNSTTESSYYCCNSGQACGSAINSCIQLAECCSSDSPPNSCCLDTLGNSWCCSQGQNCGTELNSCIASTNG